MKGSLAFTILFFLALPVRAAAPADVRIRIKEDVSIPPGQVVATAVSLMGSVNVGGTVTGDAVSVFGDVTIGPEGSVGGNAVTLGGRVRRLPGSRLGGRAVVVESPGRGFSRFSLVGLPLIAGGLAFLGALVLLASTIGFLVLVVAILVLFEPQVAAARLALVADPFRTLLLGVITSLALVPVTVFLAATIVGIPLAIAVVMVAMAAICLGAVSVCEWIGAEIARRLHRPLASVWAGLLGLAAVFLVGFVPWLGAMVHVLTIVLGLGAVVQTRFRGWAEPATVPSEIDKTGTA